jgi:hypothetical protein
MHVLGHLVMPAHAVLVQMPGTDQLARKNTTDAMRVMHRMHVYDEALGIDVLDEANLAA